MLCPTKQASSRSLISPIGDAIVQILVRPTQPQRNMQNETVCGHLFVRQAHGNLQNLSKRALELENTVLIWQKTQKWSKYLAGFCQDAWHKSCSMHTFYELNNRFIIKIINSLPFNSLSYVFLNTLSDYVQAGIVSLCGCLLSVLMIPLALVSIPT